MISGFLGAGKTTFIKALASRTHRDFAVMENEYGEVNIDGGILSQESEKLNIWELTEGCICCSKKSDFAASVLTIANTVDPEYLIVEPTGVGMLSQVLQNIQKIQYEKIQLLSPVTLLDGNSFLRYHGEFPEIYEDQVRSAGTILVSKMESASSEELSDLEARILAIHPDARICLEHYSRMEDAWFEDLLSRSLSGEVLASASSPSTPESLSLTDISLSSSDQLLLLLNGSVSGVFGNICRSKGCLKAGDSWLRFDTADRTYSLTGSAPQEEAKAVFIGSGLRRSLLREALQQDIFVTACVPPRRSRR